VMQKMNSVPLNDLARWDETDRLSVAQAVQEVINSGHFINGPKTAEFKAFMQQLLGGREVVLVGNGTDALALSLLGLGIKRGDVIATVSNAGGYATGAILRIGAIPLLIDVDPRTAQISKDDLQFKLKTNSDVSAVVVTHLYGLMADMKAILEVTNRFGCFVIEDCAQSIGAVQDGLMSGAFGDASTFSFYPTKNLSCLGDGGCVSFKIQEHADTARELAQYGWSSRYVIDKDQGFNSRLDEIHAAVLLERAKSLDFNNERRRKIVKQYQDATVNSRRFLFADDYSFVGHLAVMVTESRDLDTAILHKSNIATGIHYPILDHHQVGWRSHFHSVELPNSEYLVKRIVSLPCFPLLHESEIERVCEALQSL
jgi:aminotransferase EvaB